MNNTDTSKLIALILRHKPEAIGITLDEHGWANVDELIAGINKKQPFDMQMLEEIVATDNRVKKIIQNRQKCSIKAIFAVFAVALRQQSCRLKTTNLIFTPSIFDAGQFKTRQFGLNQGEKRRNTLRMPSIFNAE